MELDDEIQARVRAARSIDKKAKLDDFQLRAGENGSVLINVTTGRAQFLYDDESDLHDMKDLNIDDKNKGAAILSQNGPSDIVAKS